MAFEDAALERAIRAETRLGATVLGDREGLTVLGNGWMAEIPMHALFDRLRATLGTLVEMLGKMPDDGVAVTILRQKGCYALQTALPEAVSEWALEYIAEEQEEEVRHTNLSLGTNALVQKRGGEMHGLPRRGPNLNVRTMRITPAGIVREKDEDTGERLYRRAFRPGEDTHTETEVERWKHLEAVTWCDWGESDADESA